MWDQRGVDHQFISIMSALSLIPTPKEAEEERPGFDHSCINTIIYYLSMCTRGKSRNKHFRCHMGSWLTSISYSELKQRGYLCTSITMSAINACRLCQASVKGKNSVTLVSTTGIRHKLTDRIVYLVYLLEVSGNKLIISGRYHTKNVNVLPSVKKLNRRPLHRFRSQFRTI